ncbi:TonB family protein [Pontibacter sp. BT310]|uniref:Energy transducer TonB n=1 Tax=Pontibacter populi TaxID=890055 RepID=A0ABS6XC19_9BACT|nr:MULTISPECIES: TonB family protein [Pontibacter]MBJ6118640.1 TonB family protein [Pontibacter sp. BT310]MBR0571069.1 TonB family protein [Microvirga sp. STS03]MBW3365494.1 energy transducer TonB [Pontibacter populi]
MKNLTTLKTLLAAPLMAFAVAVVVPSVTIAQNKIQENKIFSYVDQMPKFEGGETEMMKFMAGNIAYPADAKANGLEGLVVVSFVIEETGKVKDAKVLKKLGRGTDEEALRVVNLTSGKWTPGSQNGKIVPVQFTLPIRFSLSEAERAATADKANQMPQFKGGPEAMQQTIAAYLQLPEEAKKENLDARVIVKFYVEKDGTVSNIRLDGTKLKKTIGADADMDYMDASTFQVQNKVMLAKLAEAALAAVAATSGKWEPATKNGQATGAELVLPVQFYSSANMANQKQMNTPAMSKYTKEFYALDEVDVQPVFKDGSFERYMAKNLRYPATSFEGYVETGFVLKADGTLMGPLFYAQPTSNTTENAAIYNEIKKLVTSLEGKWEPAKVDGKPVTVTKKITIQFVTNDGSKKPADTSGKKADVVITKLK